LGFPSLLGYVSRIKRRSAHRIKRRSTHRIKRRSTHRIKRRSTHRISGAKSKKERAASSGAQSTKERAASAAQDTRYGKSLEKQPGRRHHGHNAGYHPYIHILSGGYQNGNLRICAAHG
jgi:hypothetical protein